MMMMSMFSSFDALFAESLGQKSWFLSVPATDGTPRPVNKITETEERKKSSPPTPSANDKASSQLLRKRPRFAPEFDGLHCFETILPY